MAEAQLVRLLRTLLTSIDHRIVFLRFAAVGGALVSVQIILATSLALGLGIAPMGANVTAHLLCIPPTYLLQRTFAFRSNAPHARAFTRYTLLQLPLVALGTLLTWLLIDQARWNVALGFVVICPLMAFASFLAQRLWAFPNRS